MINFSQLDLMVHLVGEYGNVVKLTAGRSPEWLDRQRKDYINSIIDCQQARFPDKTLLGAISELLTPSKIPDDDHLRCPYGDVAAAEILDHFAKSEAEEYHIDSVLFKSEYKVYKQAVVDTRNKKNHSPPLSGLKSAAQLFRGSYFFNLKKVYLFGRIAMLAATDNERLFSLYKEIETDRRCNLEEGILNSLMMIASNGPPCEEFRRSALLQSAIDIWYRGGPRLIVLHGRDFGEPATSTLNDDERGNLARMLAKGKGCCRADDVEQVTPVTNKQYPFKSGSFISPTVKGIPSANAVAGSWPSGKTVADNSSGKVVTGIPSAIAVTGDSEAKRHKPPVSRSRFILSQSLYSNANMDASELDVSEKIALDLNKAKDWRKPAGVPKLTAAQEDLDLSTNVEPEPDALLPGARSLATIKERSVLRNPSAAQRRELNKLQMDLAENAAIPKVSDSTNAYGALSDGTPTARVITPSRRALEHFGYHYGK